MRDNPEEGKLDPAVDDHIKHVCTKISSSSWALLKLRNYVDLYTLKTVYYGLKYSHLQYCISTWGMTSENAWTHWKNCTNVL